MERGLEFEKIDFWCKRIVNDVKLNAQADFADRLAIEAAPNAQGKVEINFNLAPELVDRCAQCGGEHAQENFLLTIIQFNNRDAANENPRT